MRATRFSDVVVGHGEGPVWWPEEGLRITDAYRGRIVSLGADGTVTGSVTVGSFVGAFRPRVGGGVVAAALRSFVLADPDGTTRDLGELWGGDELRMNDGSTDPDGSFLCGSMQTGDPSGGASLLRLSTDGEVSTVLTGVSVSNGLVWSGDGRQVYYNDTPTHRVDVFDVAEDGSWHDRRPVADLGEDFPDGMTIDVDGRLWVAIWGGGQVRCLDPVTGRTLEVVEVDGPTQTSACTFGGPDLDQLFITTSDEGGSGGPLAGSVFVAQPGVRGLLPVPYGA
jgi:sugar lactone lactonase YvrE